MKFNSILAVVALIFLGIHIYLLDFTIIWFALGYFTLGFCFANSKFIDQVVDKVHGWLKSIE